MTTKRVTFKELLENLSMQKYISLESILALDSFLCTIDRDALFDIKKELMFEEHNRTINEDDVWERVKEHKISSQMICDMYKPLIDLIDKK